MDHEKFNSSFERLKIYCESHSFKGFDPYDGLNSKIFRNIPLLKDIPFIRLCWIQFFKKSPVNLRKLMLIQAEYNPKAIGLFLSAYCELYKYSENNSDFKTMLQLKDILLSLKSSNYSNSSWGYNFDWQSRAFFHPAYTPNIVTTSFNANALLDLYEITRDEKLLCEARSSCDFILNDLNRSYDYYNNIAFSYSPLDNSVVFNASLLGARLLARVFSKTNEIELKNTSKSVVKFCCNHQKKNGAWNYGKFHFHKWEDNFHTGYNLECIYDYMKFTEDDSFMDNLSRGFNYYINTFFLEDGTPKYYNNAVYPIDIHCCSQLLVTLSKLNKINDHKKLLDKVINWTIDNMQSSNGSFYFQRNKIYSNKISYMRWSQAWMMLSMSIYLKHFNNKQNENLV